MPDVCEVAIIGAGTSGLTAAYQLRDLNPVVLESDSEIGGRSRRVELAGRPTTSGAEGWYDPNPNSAESRFLADVGIECKGVKGPVLLHANGQIVRMASPERLAADLGLSDRARPDFVRTFKRVGEACAALNGNPVPDRLIEELLRTSAIEWLGPVHEEVTAFYRRLCACEQGTYFGTASAFQFVYGMPPFGGASDIWMEILVPHGGAPMISVALADALERQPVTAALVTAVEQNGSRATISYRHNGEQKTLNARHVIVATPPPVTTEIVRSLPPEKLAAIGTIAIGPIVEVIMVLADDGSEPWHELSAMWTIDKTFSVCLHSKTDDRSQLSNDHTPKSSAIKMIAVGTSAGLLADRSDEAIAEAFINDFIDMFPGARGRVQAHLTKRWVHAALVPRIGYHDHVAELLKPVGSIHFAGDWCGFVNATNPGGLGIEGDWGTYAVTAGLNSAVRAGMRAASEIRARAT